MESSNLNTLIASIKKEASKLKRTLTEDIKAKVDVTNCNPLLPIKTASNSNVLPPFPKITSGLQPQETITTDVKATRLLIDNLIHDNKMLHEDIEDFKITLELLVEKLKDSKRELDFERLKNAQIDILEQQISKEQAKKQVLLQQNLNLKERYLALMTTMREAAFIITEDNREDITLYERLARENAQLKEMLSNSRISDPRKSGLDKVAEEEENGGDKYKATLKNYREQKLAQKRSKSFAIPGRKNYLLMSPKGKGESSGNDWDNFFKTQEQRAKK
jgi:dsDNA-binding SOS-regulon protein